MDIPLYMIAFLGIGAVSLIGMRIRMGRGEGARTYFESGACKTIGSREIQGDAYGIVEDKDGIMAVLADGMGNGFGGKVASRIAVEIFEDMFQDKNAFYNPQYSFRKAFHGANKQIVDYLNGDRGAASVAASVIKNRKLYYASVGNVKIAVYRNKELVPLTSGHTIGALAKKKYIEGTLTRQEALSLLERHRLYNYVGQDGFWDIEFFDTPINLHGGEYIVLLSNGMCRGVSWKEMEECLERGDCCEKMALDLVQLVNGRIEEDMDNASIVIIRVF
ncbi:MAG: SpoIIE family protein phosphatase [Lachnospiraceae bacterium]|jgi:serine/threonine protein phosphatase PrpC|nr:SpoIIE family protein phosphatase [Lachnospiraceae bacterium]